jgi:hypothetical protein
VNDLIFDKFALLELNEAAPIVEISKVTAVLDVTAPRLWVIFDPVVR